MKILAVTGGAQGIGRALAYQFADAGYAVSIADIGEEAGLEAARIVACSIRSAAWERPTTLLRPGCFSPSRRDS